MKEKRLNLLGNKLLGVCIVLLIISCTSRQDQTNQEVANLETEFAFCEIDRSINNLVFLNDASSILEHFAVDSITAYDDWIYFANSNKSEYMRMQTNFGGRAYEFKTFEVALIPPATDFIPQPVVDFLTLNEKEDFFSFTPTDFEKFYTESGITLGMNKTEVISIFDKKDVELTVADNTTDYYYLDEECLYEYELIFKNEHLYRFKFGYITP